jgi:hypothetical protein
MKNSFCWKVWYFSFFHKWKKVNQFTIGKYGKNISQWADINKKKILHSDFPNCITDVASGKIFLVWDIDYSPIFSINPKCHPSKKSQNETLKKIFICLCCQNIIKEWRQLSVWSGKCSLRENTLSLNQQNNFNSVSRRKLIVKQSKIHYSNLYSRMGNKNDSDLEYWITLWNKYYQDTEH